MKAQQANFWTQLESKKWDKNQIANYLIARLGQPNNKLSSNCLAELTKKITSYYQEKAPKNHAIYSLTGSLTSPEQVIQKKFKEGKRMGQTYYVLQIGTDKLQVLEENLKPAKWNQIKKLAILNQNLVFKYRKWITNKELLDFLPNENVE